MSKRLASFAGPSTPTSSPVKPPSSARSPSAKSPPPKQAARQPPAESPFHRRLRATLVDIRSVAEIWNDLVLRDGLDAAKSLVDTRTDLTNTLASYPDGVLPSTPVVSPRLQKMNRCSTELDSVIAKLKKCFNRLVSLIDSLQPLYQDAVKQRGFAWTLEPMWFTWSLQSFADRLPSLLAFYHRSLHHYIHLVQILEDDNIPFESAREAIQQWAGQRGPGTEDLDGGWDGGEWEETCRIEVGRWDGNE